MSTRTHLTTATATTSGTGCRTRQDASGIVLNPAEVALLRVSAKPGAEGNELILRSGVIVPLTYAEAVEMRESLLLVEELATHTPNLRKALFKVVG